MKFLIELIKALFQAILGKTKEEEESYHDIGPEGDKKVNKRNPFNDSDFHE